MQGGHYSVNYWLCATSGEWIVGSIVVVALILAFAFIPKGKGD